MASINATNTLQSDQVATDAAISRIRAAIRSHNSPRQLKSDIETIEDIESILKELDATLGKKCIQGSDHIDEDLHLLVDTDAQGTKAQDCAIEKVWQPGLQLSLPISSHPRDFAPYDHHIDEIETFEKDLLEAKRCCDVKPVRYTKVEVLLITWEENDDITEEVEEEVMALTKLFKRLNFTIKPYAIPNVNCQNDLLFEVLSFLRPHQNDPSDETLLIIYYNGHGSIRDGTSFWHPTEWAASLSDRRDLTSPNNGPTVEWNEIQARFGSDTTPDTLFILDCCYAGAAVKHKGPGHAMELLAACGSGDRTEAGKNSFTLRIVKCIREMLRSPAYQSFQVAWLYESLINASQTPLPIHVNLNRSHYSISLSALNTPHLEIKPAVNPPIINELLSLPSVINDRGSSSPASFHAPEGSIFSDDNNALDAVTSPSSVVSESVAPEAWQYKVLLTVKLKSNILPKANNWCLNFPSSEVAGLEEVKVESLYPTKSTLLLVTMPVRLWLLLKDNPAYTFIDFVKTGNMLGLKDPGPGVAPVPNGPFGGTNHEKDAHVSRVIASRLAAMQDFFEKTKRHDRKKEKPPGVIAHKCQQIAHKFHIPSRLESDPTFGLVQHVVQQINIIRNDKGEYTGLSNYDSYFSLQIEKRFESGKKSVQEAIHHASSKGDDLENTITSQIDELEADVVKMTRLEAEKMAVKNYFIDPSTSTEFVPKKARSRNSFFKPQQHEVSIPEDQEAPKSVISQSIPKIDPASSAHNTPRTDSGKSPQAVSARRKSGVFTRKFSAASVRTNTSTRSPRTSGHHLSPGISVLSKNRATDDPSSDNKCNTA